MNDQFKKSGLAILSIVILLLPVISMYYIDQYQLTTIEFEIEENGYTSIGSGEYLHAWITHPKHLLVEVDSALLNYGFAPSPLFPIGDADRNTMYIRDSGQRAGIYNYTKPIGDNNLFVAPNYNIGIFQANGVLVYMNFTTHNLSKYSAIIFNTTATHGDIGFYLNNPDSTYQWIVFNDVGIKLDNTTWLIPISNEYKLQMLSYQDRNIWVYFWDLNITDLVLDFSIELTDTSGIFTIQPFELNLISMAFILTIMAIFTVFITDGVDIITGKKARNR